MIPVTKLNSQYGLFIDGAWRPSADGKTFDSFALRLVTSLPAVQKPRRRMSMLP